MLKILLGIIIIIISIFMLFFIGYIANCIKHRNAKPANKDERYLIFQLSNEFMDRLLDGIFVLLIVFGVLFLLYQIGDSFMWLFNK